MSGWSKEQWEEFCQRAGIDPKAALKSGEAHLAERRRKGQETANQGNARAKAKRKAKGPIAAGVPYTEREQDPGDALGPASHRTQPLLANPGRKPRVSITIRGYRLRLLDPDNFVGGSKQALDGLIRAGIAADDSPKAIAAGELAVHYEQVLVKSFGKECTEIEIEWSPTG